MPSEQPSTRPYERARPEIWGGLECTVNRVGEQYFDQFRMTGHARRVREDLDLVASLGVRTLRYPALWEHVSPERPDKAVWSLPDAGLGRIRELGIKPIVGLLHHGSGPKWTGITEPRFPELLAAHAERVARRYPWVEAYTPVNEPLTTARFCGLYGHWHPHARSDAAFVRALLNQCRGIVLSMRAIRAVNPAARLVQTEDLGKIQSTSLLAYQARFENERRWLACDLLRGGVDRGHALWPYLLHSGAKEDELEWFLSNPCPPDILGFNHYLTSERFLDHRIELYPGIAIGGNGRHAYVDVETVRASPATAQGPLGLLREAWERYRSPLAVTETHLGCTREDQVRWLREVWDAACALAAEGGDIRAVTVWSLFGSCEWNSLVTRRERHYEPGAFDIRSPSPRPTALAALLRELASGRSPNHHPPFPDAPGWWRRSEKSAPPALEAPDLGRGTPPDLMQAPGGKPPRPVLITGASGTLGRALARACRARGLHHVLLGREQMDIADPRSVREAMESVRPWAVLNAAGYVRVDDAESEPERCRRENTEGPSVLAAACARADARFMTFSSDLVFDGTSQRGYLESDPVSPLNVYGRSKAEAEARLRLEHPQALVIRTSAFFGPWDRHNFVFRCLDAFRRGETVEAADDVMISPTYLPDLTDACLDLLLDGEEGIWHLANAGAVTWAELARRVAAFAKAGKDAVAAVPSKRLYLKARRPSYSVLGSERGWILPSLETSLERCLGAIPAKTGPAPALDFAALSGSGQG